MDRSYPDGAESNSSDRWAAAEFLFRQEPDGEEDEEEDEDDYGGHPGDKEDDEEKGGYSVCP